MVVLEHLTTTTKARLGISRARRRNFGHDNLQHAASEATSASERLAAQAAERSRKAQEPPPRDSVVGNRFLWHVARLQRLERLESRKHADETNSLALARRHAS